MGERDGDDQSMSEILASIRRIVTDEESARRDPSRTRMPPLLLTPDMRDDDGEDAPPASPQRREPTLDAPPAWNAPPDETPPTPGFIDSEPLMDFAGEPMEREQHAAADHAPPEPQPEPEEVPPQFFAAPQAPQAPPEPALDEEAIREIVRGAVRDELKGPIGKQISAKVRRMIQEETRILVETLLEEERHR